ncbi:MAG: TatD family hydrolase [Chlamydiota bacterium]
MHHSREKLPAPYFDAHAHISSMERPEEIIARAAESAPFGVLNICTNEKTLEEGLRLGKKYPYLYNAGATVPNDVDNASEESITLFEKRAREGAFVAVGETGLDYYYETKSKERQKRFLKRYLHLAWETSLPLIFHCRNAFADLFAFCDAEYGQVGGFPAMVHCFTGSEKEAEGVLKRGWFLSCSGIVTYKKSEALRQVIGQVPIERLLVETDCPYLAPQSVRGKVNEPRYLWETIEMVANIKHMPTEEVAKATYQNAHRLFSLSGGPSG